LTYVLLHDREEIVRPFVSARRHDARVKWATMLKVRNVSHTSRCRDALSRNAVGATAASSLRLRKVPERSLSL